LFVDSNRAAQVFLDGNDTGLVTPTLAIRLAAGEHVVELRDGVGAAGPPKKIRIQQGQTLRLELEGPPEDPTRPSVPAR
jgi:hypothetical protein